MNMHAKISASTAVLAQLLPGQDYPDGNINARVHYTDAEIEELAASLRPDQDGQLRPFLVAMHPKTDGKFFVFGGGRRRLAYERLIARGELPKDHPIEIQNFGHISVEEALSKSLADNQAVQMHPADQAVTFAKLAADKTPEQIAKARGMTVRAVSGLIALGQDLIPEVIANWRAGKLDRQDVQVLVLATPEQQKEVLKELAEDGPGSFNPHRFRETITANKDALMRRLLGFVGVEAARAGGIEVVQDFFGQGGVVKELPKLEKMANTKMRGLEKAEREAGWSWTDGKISELRSMHHGYGEQKAKLSFTSEEEKLLEPIDKRLKELKAELFPDDEQDREQEALEQQREDIEAAARARAYTEKQKSTGGVMIRLRADGSVQYLRGLIRHDAKVETKTVAKAAPAQQQREQEPLNYAARNALEDWQSVPLGTLLAKRPHDAVAAMLAGAHHDSCGSVVEIDLDVDHKAKSKDYGALFAKFRKMTDADLIKTMGALVPNQVRAADYKGQPKSEAQAIIKVVGEQDYQDAMAKAFDPKLYFGGASKKHMLACAAEALGTEAHKKHATGNEDALRKELIAGVGKSGWLPPELRTKAYKGPSAKSPFKPMKHTFDGSGASLEERAARAKVLAQAKKAADAAKKKAR